MTIRFVALLALLLSHLAHSDTIRLSEPVASDKTSETFGAVFDKPDQALSLAELMASATDYQNQSFVLRTQVAKVCQKKGCFFIAREGATAVRIAFKDYGFFIPTDAGGKTVLLHGELVNKTLNDKQADHFNKDIGATNVFKAGATYEIVASGITIPKA